MFNHIRINKSFRVALILSIIICVVKIKPMEKKIMITMLRNIVIKL